MLKATGLAALGAGLSACAPRQTGSLVWPAAPRRFARVHVSEDRIIRTVVGLRPYRPSGFVVCAEKLGDKTVVHNYGHGGGGITLSWGTSELAVDEAWATGEKRFAVLGCGAVGLASARLLQQRGADVTIYAKDLPPQTTSNIAGGQWSPTSVMDQDRRTPDSDARLARAARLSHRRYQQLPAAEFGIRWIENYVLSDRPLQPWWEQELTRDLYPEWRDLRPGEHPFPTSHARHFTTLLVEPHVYLTAMLRDVRLAGGRVVVRELAGREQLADLPEPVVMNCTGLGAKALFGDEELEPVRGQLTFLLPQPEVDYIVIADGLYMFPRRDGILLGGTFEHGNWSLDVDEATRRRIVDGHRALFDGMR
ncbi:MAG: FAD-dependent oxidoreductase [Acidobacteria bacterium]|nr:MAG: FAD-dependent oxidoreductase [Acidobacteriota bacterium]